MGASQSNFDYDGQLLGDVSKWHSVEVDEKGNLIEPPKDKKDTCILDGRNPRRRWGLSNLMNVPYPEENEGKGYRTLWEVFQRAANKFRDNKFLGTRRYEEKEGKTERGPFQWSTYGQIDEECRAVGGGLVKLGYKGGDNIGIFAPNRAEWVITQLGLYSQSMRVVALYATLGPDSVRYIINHAELPCVFASADSMDQLFKAAKGSKIKHVIMFDVDEKYNNTKEVITEEMLSKWKEIGISVLPFSEVKKLTSATPTTYPSLSEAVGTTVDTFPHPPQPDDIAMIMYTSGTTGDPKGAIISHKAIVATAASVPVVAPLFPTDRHLSYLPLAHIFETVVQGGFWLTGGSIGFFQNNIKKLTDDIIELKPTLFAGVPRVFTRIYQTVFNGVAQRNCLVRYFFHKAYATQCHNLRMGLDRDEGADKKIFVPLRTRVGLEQCRLIITGAAPCPPYLLEFLRVAIGASVMQGYGLTESSAGGTICDSDDRNSGHTGAPICCTEVKLVEVADSDYKPTGNPARGEVWLRGDNIFAGYYKDEKNTEEALHDGWLATGDVGRWNPNGTLSIIDRKKNIFKLSQGEYVAAERVETEYGKCGIVGQIWVYGNSFKSFLLAVVVPNADVLSQWCRGQGYWIGTAESKIGSDTFADEFKATLEGPNASAIKAHVVAEMKQFEKPLKGFEKLNDIILEGNIDRMGMGFTEVNSCLTPTFKLRRPQLLQKYIVQLKEMYGKNGEPVGADEKWPGEK